ncbi:HAD family hydrolase [Williamsia sterculiae]|uniref:Haloacid dehalogenase superfamily, subfamily IA, variant 2 with 3rd motif like haloacid dehalogenase/haloacid dehalogenase superfamily, subfamily IA, variant 1 with third motif having Dx(3-4)D or D... n=1 Tax=Williamsia sterculiae TaxID=1344003 RepID=A0A1N7DU34_9NOCA|nr:HAD-IA family hydrolase [Williamsia sterculiae]SIR79318.1 Haloacid dehalogenase superfamily, subfamily IA, variant 2 with 3rd motif like haloacid dehalogenase/haloacid dehalogenase superfamily, subfamily IA, variant 1 with third motif having Dx(3-4)D or Dx(3-4)E [Williamsia sterculiae]
MTAAPPRAVLFDFSGTLFRFTEQPEWFAELHDVHGNPIDLHLQAELIRRMTAPTGVPVDLGPEDRHAWENRDLDPDLHRRAYLAVLRASGLSVPGHAESLYGRVIDPHSWTPYPDTIAALRTVRDAGVPVGIVSNIAFDLRPVFALAGVDDLVDTLVLSYEVGLVKPDPGIFTLAFDRLGVPAQRGLMVGDSAIADGAAAGVGAAFAEVEPAPVADRPDALLTALADHGFAASG